MLYKSLKVMIARDGLTAALRTKIDLLYALGRLTDAEYLDLIGGSEEVAE